MENDIILPQHELITQSERAIISAIGQDDDKKATKISILNILKGATLCNSLKKEMKNGKIVFSVSPSGYDKDVTIANLELMGHYELYAIMWEYFKKARLTPNVTSEELSLYEQIRMERSK